MKIDVPHFKQDNADSCAPAVLHMLTAYYGNKRTSRRIQQMVNSDPAHGTKNVDFISAAEELGFEVYYKSNANLNDIKGFIEADTPVVVTFKQREDGEGHYSLVIGITDEKIIFNDPLLGASFEMPLGDFENSWRSGYEDSDQWLMTAKLKQ